MLLVTKIFNLPRFKQSTVQQELAGEACGSKDCTMVQMLRSFKEFFERLCSLMVRRMSKAGADNDGQWRCIYRSHCCGRIECPLLLGVRTWDLWRRKQRLQVRVLAILWQWPEEDSAEEWNTPESAESAESTESALIPLLLKSSWH